jgi:hypothetical protein
MCGNLAVLNWLYRASLALYPAEFRRQFGAEMVQVFEDQLEEEWERRSVVGIAHAAATAAWEIVSIALSLRLNRRISMQGQTPIATLAIVLGALETGGGVQELVYAGIIRSQTYPLVAGTLGAVAGALLLAAGIAFLGRSRLTGEIVLAAACVSVPVFILIGIVTRIAGWPITAVGVLFPLLLLLLARAQAKSSQSTPAT